MSVTLGKFLEITFVLILVFLVVTNAKGFSSVMGSLAAAYTTSVRALQGR